MKKNIEPIILTLALVLLIATAAGLAYTFPSASDITGVSSTVPSGKNPIKLQESTLKEQTAAWDAPAQWPESEHLVFTSEPFLFYPDVYPDGNYVRKVQANLRTSSGVLVSWYQKYGIDFTNPNADREDPDNDGFSNIVEFENGAARASDVDGTKSTSPMDPQSHPSYLGRLRLQKYESRPFHIQFRGIQILDGVPFFQIFLRDEPSYSQPGLKKTGDPLGFENYMIGPYKHMVNSKKDPATGIVTDVDDSTLELDKPDIGFKIILTFRQESDSPESTADLVMLMPTETDKVIKVARGKSFSVPFIEGATFVLIDVDNAHAVIRKQGTTDDIAVPLLDPREWDLVPQGNSGHGR